MTTQTGGIRQLDHVEEFISAIHLYYHKTNDKEWLSSRIIYARKAWQYLNGRTKKYLLVGDYSNVAGNDWADQIRRNGESSFINAYWYKNTLEMEDMEKALGNKTGADFYQVYASRIKDAFNQEFWIRSKPKNCDKGQVGHYLSWVDKKGPHDYFEVDGNALAVAVGLSDEVQSSEIMDFINNHFDYFVDKNGASRVLCGTYSTDDTAMKAGVSQNGGYWYIVSYYMAFAEKKTGHIDRLLDFWNRVATASEKYKNNGLTEWYYEGGEPGGAMNYSWSLALPLFLKSLLDAPCSF